MKNLSLQNIDFGCLVYLPVVLLVLIGLFNNELIDVVTSTESCHMREVDLCTTLALSIIQNPKGLPVADSEIDQQCVLLKEAVDCTDNYTSRCLDYAAKGLVDMFFVHAKQMRSEFCTRETKLRETYKKHAPCLNGVRKHFMSGCLTDLQVAFEGIHKAMAFDKMTLGCCNLNRFQECTHSLIEQKCGVEAMEFIKTVLERAISRMPRMICRDYKPASSRCTRALPASGTKAHVGRNVSAISRLLSTYTNMNSNY